MAEAVTSVLVLVPVPVPVRMIVAVVVAMNVTVLVVAHVVPLPVRAVVDVPRPRSHYVRMSARMHLSTAHDAHPRTPGEEQFALAAEILALLGDRTRLTLLHALAGERPTSRPSRRCAGRPGRRSASIWRGSGWPDW